MSDKMRAPPLFDDNVHDYSRKIAVYAHLNEILEYFGDMLSQARQSLVCSDHEEKMMSRLPYTWRQTVASICAAGFVMVNGYSTRMAFGDEHEERMTANGGGTTIIHGGTGASGGFAPVITTVAFHAEREGEAVTGFFDCLALAAEVATGNGSGQFTKNVMYVIGDVTGMTVDGETAVLTGKASITGLGAGSNVPFKFVVHRGGPGASSTLTVNTLTVSFNEILVQGSFQVSSQ